MLMKQIFDMRNEFIHKTKIKKYQDKTIKKREIFSQILNIKTQRLTFDGLRLAKSFQSLNFLSPVEIPD